MRRVVLGLFFLVLFFQGVAQTFYPVQQFYPDSFFTSAGSSFGAGIAINGDYVAVAAPSANNNKGAVYIYVKIDTLWRLQATLTSSSSAYTIGSSIAFKGNTLVAGGSYSRIFVFEKPLTGWKDTTESQIINANIGVTANVAVDLSDDETTIAAAMGSYRISVFHRTGSDWSVYEYASLQTSDSVRLGKPFFGGVYIAAAEYYSDSTKIYVFAPSDSGWVDTSEIAVLHTRNYSDLSSDLAFEGDVIAATGKDSIYVFVKPASGWVDTVETAVLYPSVTDNYVFGTVLGIDSNTIVTYQKSLTGDYKLLFFNAGALGWSNAQESNSIFLPDYGIKLISFSQIDIKDSLVVIGDIDDYTYGTDAGKVVLFSTTDQQTVQNIQQVYNPPYITNQSTKLGNAVIMEGDYAIATSPNYDNKGGVFVYKYVDSVWTRIAVLKPSDGDVTYGFGSSVAMTDTVIVVGAPSALYGDSVRTGKVYVYIKGQDEWQDATESYSIYPSDIRIADFGKSLDMQDSILVVGASDINKVYIYNLAKSKEAEAVISNSASYFGSKVALYGDYLVACGNDLQLAYVYRRPVNGWGGLSSVYGYLSRPLEYGSNSYFGSSVDLYGSTAVVGCEECGQGLVCVYSLDSLAAGDTLLAQAKLSGDLYNYSGLGKSVSIDGNIIVAGVSPNNAFVYEKKNKYWVDTVQTVALAPVSYKSYAFGQSVAISGNRIVVGAPFSDIIGSEAGEVDFFNYYLPDYITFHGRVVDLDGQPQSDALVEVFLLGDSAGTYKCALTDSLGAYFIRLTTPADEDTLVIRTVDGCDSVYEYDVYMDFSTFDFMKDFSIKCPVSKEYVDYNKFNFVYYADSLDYKKYYFVDVTHLPAYRYVWYIGDDTVSADKDTLVYAFDKDTCVDVRAKAVLQDMLVLISNTDRVCVESPFADTVGIAASIEYEQDSTDRSVFVFRPCLKLQNRTFSPAGYRWVISGASVDSAVNTLKVRFSNPGQYSVKFYSFWLNTTKGDTLTLVDSIDVWVGSQVWYNDTCVAVFYYYPDTVDAHKIYFRDISYPGKNQTIAYYKWHLGSDTAVRTVANPVYDFGTEGDFDISLEILTDKGCRDTFSVSIPVGKVSETVLFYADTLGNVKSTGYGVRFYNMSKKKRKKNNWTWDFGEEVKGSVLTTTDSIVEYYYADTGIYTVSVLDNETNNGFSARIRVSDNRVVLDSGMVFVAQATGLSGAENIGTLQVMPNPGKGIFFVRSGDNYGLINVYDISGHLILSQRADSDINVVDLTGERSGIYILKLISGDKVLVAKLVKR